MSGEESAVYLGLGSNVGNRAANLRMALRYLIPLARVEEVSSLYETAAVGVEGQPPFAGARGPLTWTYFSTATGC